MNDKTRDSGSGATSSFGFGPVNYALIAAGVAVVIAGYVILDGGSVTAAPLLLVLGYMVLLPAGILVGWKTIGGSSARRADPSPGADPKKGE